MSLTVELPPQLAAELAAEAARRQMPLEDYAVQVLAGHSGARAQTMSGAELVRYWHEAGIVGTRTDIADAPAHARQLRDQAQRRERG
ncbi:MAG TPA: hypothetical protein VFV87_00225 [Pirellulaceae bacterium]|nr:hypothetical protein [Pirellulaceae bacterium]